MNSKNFDTLNKKGGDGLAVRGSLEANKNF